MIQSPREKYLRQVISDWSIYESNLTDRKNLSLVIHDWEKLSDLTKSGYIREAEQNIINSLMTYYKNERNYPELLGFTKTKNG
jgi:hypothetical protein